MNLYDISENVRALLESIANGELPEEAIADTLESAETLLSDKVDNIVCVIREKTNRIGSLDSEIKRLSELKTIESNACKRLKQYLQDSLSHAGKRRVDGKLSTVYMRNNAERLIIDDQAELIKWLEKNADNLIVHAPPTVDKKGVKDLLAIKEVPNVHTEVSESVVIK